MVIKKIFCAVQALSKFMLVVHLINGQTQSDIKRAKEYVKKTGMTEAQVRSAAKAQGYSEQQIDNVIRQNKEKNNRNNPDNSVQDVSQIEDLKSNNTNQEKPFQKTDNDSKQNNDLGAEIEDNLDLIEEPELILVSKGQEGRKKLEFFGYKIFKQDPGLFQATSVGAVDPEYLIGPGDEIIIMLWGETQFRQVFKVDREGFVFIPEIGQVFVNGLNLNLLESKLFRVFSQSYASLNPKGMKATTFLDVSLGNLRPLRIQVIGEVSQPGAYTVSPSATLFSSLYYFKGPTNLGSLREIRLIRRGEVVTSIDFYNYLLNGKKTKDEKLQLDDVIFIPKRLKTVSIEGAINRPGIYELKNNETLKDLIDIAGDLKITAYLDRAQIDRIIPFEQRKNLGMDRMFSDVDLNTIFHEDQKYHMRDGDKVQIFSVLDLRQNIVQISGAITRPGTYELGDSLRLSDLIIKADSLLGDAYLNRADITRIRSDFTEELVKLDLEQVMQKNPKHDILLKGLDKIRIYGTSEMIPTFYVSIFGHVKQPGRYPLKENMTLYDIIFKSGGFVDEEYKKRTFLDRAELIRSNSKNGEKEILSFNLGQVLNGGDYGSILLTPDDQIRIYSKLEIKGDKNYVSIEGHVKRPGRYELFESNMTLYDLLFKSAGLEDPIHLDNTYTERADLIRFDKDRINKTIISFNLGEVLKNKNIEQNINLLPEDKVRIYSKEVFNFIKPVFINGTVRNPGKYEYKDKMTLKDLILESGGVSNDVFSYRVEVSRINPNSIGENTLSESFLYDLRADNLIYDAKNNKQASGFVADTVILEPYDQIFVRPDPYFNMQKKVSIIGAVNYPGEYSIIEPNETIYDIIKRAGGLKPYAFKEGSRFIRKGKEINLPINKILKSRRSDFNLSLLEGDQIIISEISNIFQIVGEVNQPGFYSFKKGKRIKDAIMEAGGFTIDAEKSNVFITYMNGKSKKYHPFFDNHKIQDACVIVVGQKEEEEPFDSTEFYKEVTSIFANIAQAISLLVIARAP